MDVDNHWLLKPDGRSTYPTRTEISSLSTPLGRGAIRMCIEHPTVPRSNDRQETIALFLPGWTETELEASRHSTAIRGMASASIAHPREGAIRELWQFLTSTPDIIRYYDKISDAIWDPDKDSHPDNEIAEEILEDYKKEDTKLSKNFIKHALGAGQRRKENIEIAIDALASEDYDIHVWGHSLGGIDGSMATYSLLKGESITDTELSPYIKALGLLGSGGLLKDDSINSIVPRMLKIASDERKEVIKNPRGLAKMVLRSIMFVLENPALTFHEGQYAASGRLGNLLQKITTEYKIPIINVVAECDPMFPANAVIEDTEGNIFAERVVIKNAGHNFTEHQSGAVGIIANNVAEDLENRRSGALEVNMHNLLEKNTKIIALQDTPTNEDVMADLNFGQR